MHGVALARGFRGGALGVGSPGPNLVRGSGSNMTNAMESHFESILQKVYTPSSPGATR